MKYKASVIISVYNNTSFLQVILDTLKLQSVKEFEIIISEDGCNEEMKNFIECYPFAHDFQHLTQEDLGWRKNKALNKAIRHAKSDWLIFIDGDCVVHPRFVEMHIRFAEEESILSGRRVKLDESISLFLIKDVRRNIKKLQKKLFIKLLFGKGSIKYLEEGFFFSPDGLLGFIPQFRKAKHIIGCNMSFSKKAIYAINGFDESYVLPAVGEDIDLVWRFKAAGYAIKSLRSLAVQYHLFHKENWTNDDENKNKMRENQKKNKYICDKGLMQLQS